MKKRGLRSTQTAYEDVYASFHLCDVVRLVVKVATFLNYFLLVRLLLCSGAISLCLLPASTGNRFCCYVRRCGAGGESAAQTQGDGMKKYRQVKRERERREKKFQESAGFVDGSEVSYAADTPTCEYVCARTLA